MGGRAADGRTSGGIEEELLNILFIIFYTRCSRNPWSALSIRPTGKLPLFIIFPLLSRELNSTTRVFAQTHTIYAFSPPNELGSVFIVEIKQSNEWRNNNSGTHLARRCNLYFLFRIKSHGIYFYRRKHPVRRHDGLNNI